MNRHSHTRSTPPRLGGTIVPLRLPPAVIARIDALARQESLGETRSQMLRRLISLGMRAIEKSRPAV